MVYINCIVSDCNVKENVECINVSWLFILKVEIKMWLFLKF